MLLFVVQLHWLVMVVMLVLFCLSWLCLVVAFFRMTDALYQFHSFSERMIGINLITEVNYCIDAPGPNVAINQICSAIKDQFQQKSIIGANLAYLY